MKLKFGQQICKMMTILNKVNNYTDRTSNEKNKQIIWSENKG